MTGSSDSAVDTVATFAVALPGVPLPGVPLLGVALPGVPLPAAVDTVDTGVFGLSTAVPAAVPAVDFFPLFFLILPALLIAVDTVDTGVPFTTGVPLAPGVDTVDTGVPALPDLPGLPGLPGLSTGVPAGVPTLSTGVLTGVFDLPAFAFASFNFFFNCAILSFISLVTLVLTTEEASLHCLFTISSGFCLFITLLFFNNSSPSNFITSFNKSVALSSHFLFAFASIVLVTGLPAFACAFFNFFFNCAILSFISSVTLVFTTEEAPLHCFFTISFGS